MSHRAIFILLLVVTVIAAATLIQYRPWWSETYRERCVLSSDPAPIIGIRVDEMWVCTEWTVKVTRQPQY